MSAYKYCFVLYLLISLCDSCIKKKKITNDLHQVMPGPWNDAGEPSLKRADCECGDFGSRTSPRWLLFISFLPNVVLNNSLHMHGCIGTIITSNLIVTSHKCILRENARMNVFEQWNLRKKSYYYRSIIDEPDLVVSTEPNGEGELFEVENIILNGHHILNSFKSFPDNKNDILLLKMKADFTSHDFHIPICLPDNHNVDFFGKEGIYYGHGEGDHPQMNVDGIRGIVKPHRKCSRISQNEVKNETQSAYDPMCLEWEGETSLSSLVLFGGPLVFKSYQNGAHFLAGVMGHGDKEFALFANILGMRLYILHKAKQHNSTLCKGSALKLRNTSSEIIIIEDGDLIWRPPECEIAEIAKRSLTSRRGGRSDTVAPNRFYLTWEGETSSLDVGRDGKCYPIESKASANARISSDLGTCIIVFSNKDCSGQYRTLDPRVEQSVGSLTVDWKPQSAQSCTEKLGGGLSEISFYNEDKTLLQTYVRKDICGCVPLPSPSPKSVTNSGVCIVMYEKESCERHGPYVEGGTGIQADDLTAHYWARKKNDTYAYELERKTNPLKSFETCSNSEDFPACYKLHVVIYGVIMSEIKRDKEKVLIHTTPLDKKDYKKVAKGAVSFTETQETSIFESVTGINTAGLEGVKINSGYSKINSKNELKVIEWIRQAYDKKLHSNISMESVKTEKTTTLYYSGKWNVKKGCPKCTGNVEVWAYKNITFAYEAIVRVYVTIGCKIQDRAIALERMPKDLHLMDVEDKLKKSNIIIGTLKGQGLITTTFVPNPSETVLSSVCDC